MGVCYSNNKKLIQGYVRIKWKLLCKDLTWCLIHRKSGINAVIDL